MKYVDVILAAHGSRHDPSVNARMQSLAASVQAKGLLPGVVVAAFHQGSPGFKEALDQTTAPVVIIVPVMTSEGYYCNEILSQEWRRSLRTSTAIVVQTPPVGTHPRIADIVLRRVDTLAPTGGRRASVIIVGHGTLRNPQSRSATEALIQRLVPTSQCEHGAPFDHARGEGAVNVDNGAAQQTSADNSVSIPYFLDCRDFHAAFLDEDPSVQQALSAARFSDVLVIPFLIGGGPHAQRDIPDRLGIPVPIDAEFPIHGRVRYAAKASRNIVVDRAIGLDPLLEDIAVALIQNALLEMKSGARSARTPRRRSVPAFNVAADFPSKDPLPASVSGTVRSATRTLRLGARTSRLSMHQARIVCDGLQNFGIVAEIIPLPTVGDDRWDVAMEDLPGDAPFTEDIDAELSSGRIDLAVHSLKDLPISLPDDLVMAAVLPRGDVRECLISHRGLGLFELPPGACVATSSARRQAQLLWLRPDLRPAAIRGPVDSRVEQVRSGKFDAAILAFAGLERLGLLSEVAETWDASRFMPAPGQAAIVVLTRRDDRRTRTEVTRLDDATTRIAVTAELEAFRPYEKDRNIAVAAHATIDRGRVVLAARMLSRDGTQCVNALSQNDHPWEAARRVIERFVGARDKMILEACR